MCHKCLLRAAPASPTARAALTRAGSKRCPSSPSLEGCSQAGPLFTWGLFFAGPEFVSSPRLQRWVPECAEDQRQPHSDEAAGLEMFSGFLVLSRPQAFPYSSSILGFGSPKQCGSTAVTLGATSFCFPSCPSGTPGSVQYLRLQRCPHALATMLRVFEGAHVLPPSLSCLPAVDGYALIHLSFL